MFFEGLALEIFATKEGFEIIKPAVVRGTSGVDHRFSFLAAKDGRMCGVDMCQEVGQVEVLRAFLKEIDTGATVTLVCLRGKPSDEGKRLAEEYGFRIITPADIGPFFEFEGPIPRDPHQVKAVRIK